MPESLIIHQTPDLRNPQEILEEQREWLRVTLSSIGDAVITTDSLGRITFLNPVAQALTGWSSEEVIGVTLENVFRIVSEETHRNLESPTVRALREGVVVGLAHHTLLIDKNGVEHPIDDSAAPIRNRAGQIAGVVLVFRDITERRQHERAVQDALAYCTDIVAHLWNPLLVLEADLRIRSANSAYYHDFQGTPEDTEGHFLGVVGSGQWNNAELHELLQRVFQEDRQIEKFAYQSLFPVIGLRTMSLSARRLSARIDRPVLVLLNIDDITDRKNADAAMEESELRYRRLFQTAKDGILILDSESGKIVDTNPFMSDLLGHSREEFLGRELWEIGFFRDKSESQSAYQKLRASGYIRYEHLPLKTKEGREVDVEFVSNIYTVGHHEVAQCNIRDITQRVELERKTHEQAEALADLHRRKDEFLAMLSHELRNPLAPIVNALHLLRIEGKEEPIQKQARMIIERQVGQLARLVNDLLEVSRFTSGRVRVHLERFDLRSIIDRAIESARPLIDSHKHILQFELPKLPIWVNVDPTRIEQLIVNLLNNAAKYTEDRGQIWIGARQQGDEVVLIVRDTGMGISPEQIPHLFDLFTQGDRSLDRAQGGLGIGLSLVKRLAELHGGTATARSAGVGQGSEFTIRLPLADPPGLSTLKLQEPATFPLTQARKILVVDDNIDSAITLQMLLIQVGYEVEAAHTGPDAVARASTFLPDAVLLDIGLPGLDGFEVARRIRQNPPLRKVILIAMSGYGQESDLKLSREAGFDDHLVKPVGFSQVRDLIAKRLRAAETAPAA